MKVKEKLIELISRYNAIRTTIFEHAADPKKEKEEIELSSKRVFAAGYNYYKLFWIFLIGSFLGAITEILYVRLTSGEWMSRSSLLWGQFSVVWGLGCVLLTWILHKLIRHDDRYVFIVGTILGGIFEYICSLFTEIVFGCVFWDYSNIPFNINGRINLLYCFFWGIVALVWLKILYPWMSKMIERIPIKLGKVLTYILTLFFIINIMVTSAALYRMNLRGDNIPPKNWAERYIENNYTTEQLLKRYENLKMK